jgi:hypothetical protein
VDNAHFKMDYVYNIGMGIQIGVGNKK